MGVSVEAEVIIGSRLIALHFDWITMISGGFAGIGEGFRERRLNRNSSDCGRLAEV